MVEVGKIGDKTLVLDGRYISIFKARELLWKKAYMGYLLPDGNLYMYRRRVRITELSGNTLTDYQVKIEIGAGDPIFAHARSAGEDIRFCYYPEENMIPHWIEKFDPVAEEAIIWVKVPSIPANSEIEIYMYYGNPTVASGSDASATFIRVIDGLVGSWHLDEGSGDIAHDTSGNDYHGTIYGAKWVDGKFGKALEFDGVDDYVDLGPGSRYNSANGAFEAWVLADVLGDDDRLIEDRDGAPEYMQGGSWNAGTISFYITDNHVDAGGLSTGVWYHVVFVWGSEGMKLYINGELKDTDPYTGSWESSKNMEIAGDGGFANQRWNGKVDEVRFYNRILTPEEISDLYNNYGYTTTNYPGKVLVKKYTEPEPSVSVGAEE